MKKINIISKNSILFICVIVVTAQFSVPVYCDTVNDQTLRPKVPVLRKNTVPGLKPAITPVKKPMANAQLKPKAVIVKTSQPAQTATKADTIPKVPINTLITLTDYTKTFTGSYNEIFELTLTSMSKQNFKINSFDTTSGQILGELRSGLKVYAVIAPTENNLTLVRITPYNGAYNIPTVSIAMVFQDINAELNPKP